MSDFKALAKHSTNYLFATMATKALAFISIPVYTRLLSVYEYALAYMHLETCNCSASRKMEKILNLHSNSNIYKFYKDDKR